MRKIKNLPILLDMRGKPIKVLKDFKDPQNTRIIDEYNEFVFTLHGFHDIRAEQELIYRDERYRITRVAGRRSSDGKITDYECMSSFIELDDKRTIGEIEFVNLTVKRGGDRILSGTDWEMGEIEELPGDDELHSFKESDQSKLWCIRQFARICGYEIKFDTINQLVHFVVQNGRITDEIIRYKKNLREIIKTEEPPVATVIYPRGRGGLTIESVNNDVEYLEDYSWYTDELGIPLAEARQKYRKEVIWEDDRFIYAGTLMREAAKKVWGYSRPQISYETNVMYIGTNDLDIGDYAPLIDEELNVRLSVRVVRIVDKPGQEWNNEIEFNYLIPGLGSMQDQDVDPEKGQIETVLVKNEQDVSIGQSYSQLLELSVSSFASSNLQAGLYIIGQASQKTLLTGYMTFRGERFGPEIRQTVDGWHTIGLPFMMLQMQEGTGHLVLYLSVENGTFKVAKHDSELFITGMNLLGGLSSKLPRANVLEVVEFSAPIYVTDSASVSLQSPEYIDVGEEVVFANRLDVVDTALVNLINLGSIIPVMKANDTPAPYYISADSLIEEQDAYFAMDKNLSSAWLSSEEDSRYKIDLGEEQEVNYYLVTASKLVVGWTFEASNNDIDWYVLDEQTEVEFDEVVETLEFTIDVADEYRYYRWVFDNDDSIAITELDLISEVLLIDE